MLLLEISPRVFFRRERDNRLLAVRYAKDGEPNFMLALNEKIAVYGGSSVCRKFHGP